MKHERTVSEQHRPHQKYRRFIRIPSGLHQYHGAICSPNTRLYGQVASTPSANMTNRSRLRGSHSSCGFIQSLRQSPTLRPSQASNQPSSCAGYGRCRAWATAMASFAVARRWVAAGGPWRRCEPWPATLATRRAARRNCLVRTRS